MKDRELLSISQAGELLGVSINTLRNWDKSGKLPALKSAGGHRYYPREELSRFKDDIFAVAQIWAGSEQAPSVTAECYCQTQDVFRARLDHMATQLEKKELDSAPLVTAVAGEIGNNSFDHNLGSWPDVPGVFYAYDQSKRVIVLADRGRGIRATLSRVKPDLKDDIMALTVALTEKISARAPEQRGNGLKFVRQSIIRHQLGLRLQSGNAVAVIEHGQLKIRLANRNIRGVVACINY